MLNILRVVAESYEKNVESIARIGLRLLNWQAGFGNGLSRIVANRSEKSLLPYARGARTRVGKLAARPITKVIT